MAPEIIRRGHTLTAVSLQDRNDQHLTAAHGDLQALFRQGQQGAGGLIGGFSRRPDGVNLKAGASQLRRCDGPGVQTPDMVDDLTGRFAPVDGAKLFGQHGRKSGLCAVLGRAGHSSCLHGPEGVAQQARADVRQAVQEALGVFIGFDGCFADLDDIPRVHLRSHIHGGDAGLIQAVEDGPLDRPGAAKLRQNAGVDVDAAQARDVQHLLGQNLSVGNHGDDVGLQSAQLLDHRVVLESRGLEYRQSCLQGYLFYLGHFQLHPAVFRFVGLGINAGQIKFFTDQAAQTGRRNIRRSHKYNSHASSGADVMASISSSESLR